MPQEKRQRYIKLSLDDDEYKHIENNARIESKATAVYARETLLKDIKKPSRTKPPPSINKELLFQLVQIGNNINQTTRALNASDDDTAQIQALFELKDITEKLQAFEQAYLAYKKQGVFYDS